MDKGDLVRGLGGERCAAIGNGRNDAEILAEVRFPSIEVALDLPADPKALEATPRR